MSYKPLQVKSQSKAMIHRISQVETRKIRDTRRKARGISIKQNQHNIQFPNTRTQTSLFFLFCLKVLCRFKRSLVALLSQFPVSIHHQSAQEYPSRSVLSNLFDPAGRTGHNHDATGRTSKLKSNN